MTGSSNNDRPRCDTRRESATRRLAVRLRPDLDVVSAEYAGVACRLVKDPVRLQYFRFREDEFRLMQLLDGRGSVDEVCEEYGKSDPLHPVSRDELVPFLARLQDAGLLTSDAPGEHRRLLDAAERAAANRRRSSRGNLLYIKLPGFDPARILDGLYRLTAWIYTPTAQLTAVGFMLAALLLLVVNFDAFTSRREFASFHAFFNVHNIFWLWIALAATRVVHEFGHGLTCRHFGGECHEMGVLFLVLSPCLYCDVSDAWMLPSRWQRIAISLAGVWVELMMAAAATFVWWYTGPGVLHNLAFSTMVVCSVSTLLFNANPLMRYDGYYVLCDVLEIPNLRAKSQRLFSRWMMTGLLGAKLPQDSSPPTSRRALFAFYAVAAVVYRWFLTGVILLFLYTFLKPYGLRAVGAVLACVVLWSLIVRPIVGFIRFLFSKREGVTVSKFRAAFSLLALAASTAGLLLVPIPHRVPAVLTIEAADADPVFVTSPGRIDATSAAPGRTVQAGDVLVRLSNDELVLQLDALESAGRRSEIAVETFESLDQSGEAERERHASADAYKQADEVRRRIEELVLRAPRDGIVIPAARKTTTAFDRAGGDLPTETGTPLDQRNVGGRLTYGETICLVGDPRSLEAVLIIDQAQIEFVTEGCTVSLKLDSLPDVTLTGTIVEISRRELADSPRQLASRLGGELATRPDDAGNERPLRASYQARVRLDAIPETICIGCRGRAKIECGSFTPWDWLTRKVSETVRFRL